VIFLFIPFNKPILLLWLAVMVPFHILSLWFLVLSRESWVVEDNRRSTKRKARFVDWKRRNGERKQTNRRTEEWRNGWTDERM